MRPDAAVHFVPRHEGQAEYLRQLVRKIRDNTGLRSQREVADAIGVRLRTLVDYLTGASEAPYPVQYALERLAMTPKERDDARAEDEEFNRIERLSRKREQANE